VIRLAIFDFDGTLTSGHLWVGISRHHRAHGLKRLSLYSYVISHLPFWLLAKLKLYSEERNRARWGEDLAVLFKGFSPSQAREAFVWIRDNYFWSRMRPEMLGLIQEHRTRGDKTLLLSGMFEEFLAVVGERLGLDFVIGTRLEIRDGVYTGRIVPPLCFGENKARALEDFVKVRGLQIDFKNSSAYADSYYDLPVFKMVGSPIAAYPDKKLASLAEQNGWRKVGI
jgi:HAD superfamily hydrolase (TIGR01490 family)